MRRCIVYFDVMCFRLQVTLKQHFNGLKERLMVALMSVDREGCEGELERVMEEVGSVGGLDRVMKVLYKCLEKLCEGAISGSQVPRTDEVSSFGIVMAFSDSVPLFQGSCTSGEGALGEVQARSLALLEEMGRRYEEREEERTQKESMEVLETKFENLQEELANVR